MAKSGSPLPTKHQVSPDGWNSLFEALAFRYLDGADEEVLCPYSTGWRTLPCLVFNQWSGGCVRVECQGHDPVFAPSGSGILVTTGLRHNLTVILEKGRVRCRWTHIQYTLYGSVDVCLLLSFPLLVPPPQAKKLGDLSAAMASALTGEGQSGLIHAARHRRMAFHFLEEICGLSTGLTPIHIPLAKMRPLLPALAFIKEHFGQSLGRTELAATVGLSPTRFHYVFKEVFGMAPMEYVMLLRMREAQRLLMEEEFIVKEIARRCGYQDPFHFSRQFKTRFAMAPLVYRRRMRKSLAALKALRRPL